LRTIAFLAFAAPDGERARRPLVYIGVIDIATVDLVARVGLCSRRFGLEMTVHDPVPELEALLAFTGLGAMVHGR